MVIVDKSIEEMLEEIEFASMTYYEIMPTHYHGRAYSGKCFSPTEDVIEPSGLEAVTSVRFDIEDCVGYALENVWMHAVKEQPWPEMSIKGFAGNKGIIIRIRNPGKGFNHRETQRKYLEGEDYHHNYGYGFRHFNIISAEISFENRGKTINIMYKP